MTPSEAEAVIRARVAVTRQRVLLAKAIVLSAVSGTSSSDDLVAAVLRANDIVVPNPVVVHESVDTDAMLNLVGDAISWRLATIEAIWGLVHSGFLMSIGDSRQQSATIGWTTVVPGSGGTSSGWQFEDYSLPVPGRVLRAPSTLSSNNQFLSEPDLYLYSLRVVSMHSEVANSFAEAVRCFRSELFTAAVAMLGKAAEGAWLELGASLLAAVPDAEQSKYEKQRAKLEDHMIGTYKKIETVVTIFEHQEHFSSVSKSAGVGLQELRFAAVWSDTVRDSRNTIHFGVVATTPNTYEKVAALLLGAVSNIRILYRIKDAADAISKTR